MSIGIVSRGLDSRPETRDSRLRQLGLSLVELIVFIVVVGTAVAGVLAALNVATRGSADPMIQKQALAVAEALLEEVQLQPFTYCDPDDPQAATALSATVSATGCAATVENPGPEGELRLSTVTPFDNVNDYNGYDSNAVTEIPPGITTIAGAPTGLDGYRATVSVAGQAITAAVGRTVPATDSLLITVAVTGPGNVSVALHGYRVRYAPNALP